MRENRLVDSLHKRLGELCVGRTVQLVTHWGGDADSIGSSYVLSKLIKSRYGAIMTAIFIPENPTSHSKAIMSRLGFSEGLLARPDLYIAVDVGSEEQLGGMMDVIRTSGAPILLVDHHLREPKADSKTEYFTSDRYQSTAEMIYDLAEHVGYTLDTYDATALFLGIYYDTARLAVADGETAAKICALLRHG
ncbi:MAG: DHH family phosphoesterase, partial [Nitrososphaerota archaeon]